jgi:hypothetical protein
MVCGRVMHVLRCRHFRAIKPPRLSFRANASGLNRTTLAEIFRSIDRRGLRCYRNDGRLPRTDVTDGVRDRVESQPDNYR